MQLFFEEREKLKALVENSPDFMGISNTSNVIEYLNKAAYNLLGIDPSTDLATLRSADFYAPQEAEQMRQVYETLAEKGSWKGRVMLKHFKTGELIPGYGSYETVLDPQTGRQIAKTTTIRDLRPELIAQNELVASEHRIKSIISQSPVAIGVLTGPSMMIESANQSLLTIWGKTASVTGLPLEEALPEIKGQRFLELLQNVYTTGTPYYGNAAQVKLEHNGQLEDFFIDFVYAPLRSPEGDVNSVLVVANDVTPLVIAKKQAEESELFSRTVLYNSPVAKLVLIGHDMVIRTGNEKMLEMLGRDDSITGKPFLEAIPELANTPLRERMLRVFETGEMYEQPEEEIALIKNGKPYTGYYHYIYKPLRGTTGQIYGIIVTAIEITGQVLARHKIEESQALLQGAVDLANLGTWEIDLKTQTIHYDARLRSWFGFAPDEVITSARASEPCSPEEATLLRQAMLDAIKPGGSGIYDVEYTIRHLHTGQQRILHALGKTFRNASGEAYRVSGSVQDITAERQVQLELTRQVQERTEELAATNEELAASNEELQAINEEMTAINEEMEDSNKNLFRSNEELSQYAYVASHDLQEPLRKIMVYTSMLDKQFALPDESKTLIAKVSQSAGRMSLLIKDLLEYSRLMKADVMLRPVNLNDTLKQVISDFELLISEKKATVNVGPLPVVNAVGLQMNQLFYNLLSNALKFIDPLRLPVINVQARRLSAEEISRHIPRPLANTSYFDITITDNGIGFDTKYASQIFEVFKRLHEKDAYPGSGIGLALCRRIVAKHGGQLYAESAVGAGTSFHVILQEI